ncbi:DUF2075 domain-containing protein [Gilvimarinus agarilyticus]|uniref:DUF2075 domain-containing protein n=1 Tax=Gilvimarinus agarilyticus TaxID=679259 RepID=UPI0006971152|nr:DUF2075 domain-containing protein [Gilvimarinus agarilyticus]
MINPAMYASDFQSFLHEPTDSILGKLSTAHTQTLQNIATRAWAEEIEVLKETLKTLENRDTYILLEMYIPRIGRRADVILIVSGVIFVIEFKVGAKKFLPEDLRQCHGYALDLKNFHKGSHDKKIVPILVATQAKESEMILSLDSDGVARVISAPPSQLLKAIHSVTESAKSHDFNIQDWESSGYLPTPTIIEAAQALYSSHNVADITRSEADKTCIVTTSNKINDIIQYSKDNKRKSICFVTGVPGAGKTLVGLNVASQHSNPNDSLYSVFLSGNGPLVSVLQEALARDQKKRVQITIKDARRKTEQMIQNIHRFRDAHLDGSRPPEQVAIFDEAQRVWDKRQTSSFMQRKRKKPKFSMSEPELLIEFMDRHREWSVIVALIGGGQEINTGEIGLSGWVEALEDRFKHWDIYYSSKLFNGNYITDGLDSSSFSKSQSINDLHLATSMRSFRAEHLSNAIHHLVDGNASTAKSEIVQLIDQYPVRITRDFEKAKQWVRDQQRGNESAGMLASSGATRLKSEGIYVKNEIDPRNWFLNPFEDVRSSNFLEDVATEFQVQGLELDWCLVAWDADYRFVNGAFEHWQFKGTKWQKRNNSDSQRYLKNAYRVLLTRARQGMVIYVPEGNAQDGTRCPSYYDGIYDYLLSCGIESLCLKANDKSYEKEVTL